MAVMCMLMMTACDKDDEIFKLSGNIEHLIPAGSYNLLVFELKDSRYVVASPSIHQLFEYWGLALKRVEYRLDGKLYKLVEEPPFDIVIRGSDFETSERHLLSADLVIGGGECEDLMYHFDRNISLNNAPEKNMPDFYLDCNRVKQGEMLVATPVLLEDRSADRYMIDEVKYYWDNVLVGTATKPPFELNYRVTDVADTSHSIEAVISCHDSNGESVVQVCKLSEYLIGSESKSRLDMELKSQRRDYVNGQTLSVVGKLCKGNDSNVIFQANVFWDGRKLCSISDFPCTYDYKLINETLGRHELRLEVESSEKKGQKNLESISYNIFVLE